MGLLMGAIAFNFSTLQRGARLEEGANQLEALLRYSRAHASATGHRVRISFEEDVGEGLFVPLGNLNVTWEADPLAQPGTFLPLLEAASYLDSIRDLISIEEVRPPGETTGDAVGSSLPNVPAEGDAVPDEAADGGSFNFAPITFLPDGSSDSSEITISPSDDEGEDSRRMVLRLVGLTGSIRRRVILVESPESGGPQAPQREAAVGTSRGTEGKP
jgi:Type II transport protein GspH